MKFRKELIEKLANGKAAVINKGYESLVKEILKEAFPSQSPNIFETLNPDTFEILNYEFYRANTLAPNTYIGDNTPEDRYERIHPKTFVESREFNETLVNKLAMGEIAVINNGNTKDLNSILLKTFNSGAAAGASVYYYRANIKYKMWDSDCTNATGKPAVEMERFFIPDEVEVDSREVKLERLENEVSKLKKEIEESKSKLPKINGYDGAIVTASQNPYFKPYIQYGCAILNVDWFTDSSNREIAEIKLSSGVVIKGNQIDQIRKVIKNQLK